MAKVLNHACLDCWHGLLWLDVCCFGREQLLPTQGSRMGSRSNASQEQLQTLLNSRSSDYRRCLDEVANALHVFPPIEFKLTQDKVSYTVPSHISGIFGSTALTNDISIAWY